MSGQAPEVCAELTPGGNVADVCRAGAPLRIQPCLGQGIALGFAAGQAAQQLHDQVGRAYAILRYAHVLTSKEALNLLSLLRLGADLDLVPNCDRSLLDLLLLEIQPAHLQFGASRDLSPEERDALRAEITRARLQSLTGPANISSTQNPPEASTSDSHDE